MPARIIGEFDSFINKRIQDSVKDYISIKPQGEIIPEDFEIICWKEFYEKREED